MSIDKETLKQEISTLKNKVQSTSDVEAQADKTKTDFKNTVQTNAGNIVGEVKGGIESLTSKATEANSKLKDFSVEGMVTDTSDAIKGGVSGAIENFVGSFGLEMSIEWDSDGDGNLIPLFSSFNASPNSTIGAALSSITGLDVKSGFAHNIISNASPAGLNSALSSIEGRVGSFASVDAVHSLTDTAKTALDDFKGSIKTEIQSSITNNSELPASIDSDVSSSVDIAKGIINKGIEIDPNGLEKTFAELSGKDGSEIRRSIVDISKNTATLGKKTEAFTKGIDASVSNSKTGLLQGFAEDLSKDATNSIKSVAPGLSDSDIKEAINLAQEDQKSLDEAVKIVAKSSTKSEKEIKDLLQQLNTTIAGSVIIDKSQSVFVDPLEIGKDTFDETGKKIYSYVSTIEELEADLRQTTRDITEVVVHWTETYTNKDIGSAEINNQQVALGSGEIGYHYVIRRDGSIQRGRNLNSVGQHSVSNGHDKYSIGVVFVGGINCPSGTANPERFLSVSSLTRVQMNSFETFCRAFYKVYPGGQILGHNDIDADEIDPGFDVRDYCLDMFGKPSLFTDPNNQGPLSPKEINSTRL